MPPSGKIEIFRRAAAAARAAREIFRGSLFCLNFMYFLRFEHGFHVQAKLYAPRMLSGVFRAFCGSSDRAPHHATTVPKYAHARAQLAEYAWIPPLTTPIRPHATMHALLHGRLQQSIEHAHKARRRESPRLALPCRERLSCSGGRGWDSRRRGHSRGGHCARDLIMNTNDSLTWVPHGQRRWQRSSSVTAAAAAEGDSLARPELPRRGTQRMHHHPTAKAMGVMVPTPYDLRVACGGCAAQRSRGAAAL